ncbi:MBL fold metallo-hydrolase [Mycoplasmatota bacterium]|nr:MBL fold metallo-hydrolase [Mycoplasmatota bacterium]
MKITVLASGSKGNCTLIETEQNKFLIDIGISYKALKNKLSEVNVEVEDIDAIFITHEHSDHVKGLEVLIKRHNIYIVLSHGSYQAIVSRKKIGVMYEYYNVIDADEEVYLNNTCITPFHVSHDALEPFGYIIKGDNKKVVYLTDSGYISQENEERIQGANVYIMETNHNIEMLMCTNRPWRLKQRILGDNGHLCNEDALHTLLRIVNDKTQAIYLAHISEEANNVDLLMLTVKDIFSQCIHNENIKFIIAKQHELSESTVI